GPPSAIRAPDLLANESSAHSAIEPRRWRRRFLCLGSMISLTHELAYPAEGSWLLGEGAFEGDEARFFQVVGGVEAEELVDVADGFDHHRDDLVAHLLDPADVDVGDDVLEPVEAHAALWRVERGLAGRLDQLRGVLYVAGGRADGLIDRSHRRVREQGGRAWIAAGLPADVLNA